ncbi:hypothetical protein GDO81_029567, partial [Engystomops pustulosus]
VSAHPLLCIQLLYKPLTCYKTFSFKKSRREGKEDKRQTFLGAMRQEASRENRGWRLDSVYMRNEVLKHMKEDVTAPPT